MTNQRKKILIPRPPNGFPCMPSNLADHFTRIVRMPDLPDTLGAAMYQYVDTLRQVAFDSGQTSICEMGIVQRWAEYGYRTTYIDPAVVAACKHTSVLDGVRGADILNLFQARLFVLPESEALNGPMGSSSCFAIVGLYPEKYVFTDFGCDTHTVGFGINSDEETMLILISIFWTDGDSSWDMDSQWASQTNYIPARRSESLRKTLGTLSTNVVCPDGEPAIDTEVIQVRAALDLILSMLLLRQSYPEYVRSSPAKFRPAGVKKTTSTEVEYIGFSDAMKRTINVSNSRSSAESGRSLIKPHWRDGHWRRQPHGQRWEDQNPDKPVILDQAEKRCHMTLIPPTLITPKEDESCQQ